MIRSPTLHLDAEVLATLGTRVPGSKTPLSPFHHGQAGDLSAAQAQKLRMGGVLDADGSVTSAAAPILTRLATPRQFLRVRVLLDVGVLEAVLLYSDDGSATVMSTTNQGLQVRHPADPQQMIQAIAQVIGRSELPGAAMRGRLGREAALMLAAMIDQTRRSIMNTYAEGRTHAPPSFTANELLAAVAATPRQNVQWLVGIVRDVCPVDIALDDAAAQAALGELASAGHATEASNAYTLAGEAAQVAARMFTFDQVLVAEGGFMDGSGTVHGGTFFALQSGVRDVLLVDDDGADIGLTSASPAALLAYLKDLMTEPQKFHKAAAAPTPSATVEQPAELRPDTPAAELHPDAPPTLQADATLELTPDPVPTLQAQTQENFCTQCGAKMPPDAKFCSKCGFRVT